MKLFQHLKVVSKLLADYPGCWAICGGIAASLYRVEPRFTGDIDIAIIDCKEKNARELAEVAVKSLNYEPILGFIPGQTDKGVALILGREDKEGGYVGIDFLLPVLPWIEPSVIRAQHNLIDYGFSKLPTITPEDLVIAKLFAIENNPSRAYDLDDIGSILSKTDMIDWPFLKDQIQLYGLKIPDSVHI